MTRLERVCLVLTVLGSTTPAVAQDEAEPEMDFLEYLGSWQDEDEKWFLEAQIDAKQPADFEEEGNHKGKREVDEQD